MTQEPRAQIVNLQELEPTPCPCGTTRRAFLDDPRRIASAHLLEVSETARVHHHRKMTELYYIIEGEGQLELDGVAHPVRAGHVAMIHPGCRHRALGALKILVVPIPAFDPDDEYF